MEYLIIPKNPMRLKFSNKTKSTLTLFFGMVVFFILPIFVLAQGVDFGTSYLSSVGLATQDIRTTIVNILRVTYGILGVITLILIIYAGFVWMTSQGKPDAINKAKKIIINAVIGLLIIILAAAITEFIFRQINKAMYGNGSFSCNPYQCLSTCTACNATGDGTAFDNTCFSCTIGSSNAFSLNEVQTAHNGSDPKQDVYTCSRIQPRFNNRIASATVNGNVSVVERNTATVVPGTWQISSKTLKFTPDNNFSVNTGYEVRFNSPGLQDKSGDDLAGCVGTVCETLAPPHYAWEFDTGTQTDTSAPSIVSAYPLLSSQSGYPSRTVPRAATIDVNFSESIDFFTVEDPANSGQPDPSKFILQEVTCPGNTSPCTPTGNVISNSNLVISDKNNGFRVKTKGGFLLDAFTWYQITVQDVEDLCGNVMSPNPVTWVFETNDTVPGVKSVSPRDGATNVCPSADIYFTFGTTMYDEQVVLGINSGSGPQYIDLQPTELNTSNTIAGFGTLEVTDPGLPVDNKFRSFRFIPENPLTVGVTYDLTIDAPNFVIDNDGNTLHYPQSPNTWRWTVADASACACEPYISSLSPQEGPHGQCLTIKGSCFQGTDDNPGEITSIDIGGVSHPINGQGSGYVSTAIQSSLAQNTSHLVTVTLTYDDSNFGSLTSNGESFFVTADPPFTGPCLYNITPDAACNGAGVALDGTRFGATQDTVNFSISGNVLSGDIQSWNDSKIKFSVPSGWPEGFQDVSVVVGGVSSNSLPFDISCKLSGDGQNQSFRVINHWPDCDSACLNSAIGARFSSDVEATTVNNSSVDVLPCNDSSCNSFGTEPSFTVATVGNEIQINNITLNPDTYYRVVLHDSILGVNGSAIGNLNYSYSGGGNDSYSWTFKTTNQNCTLTGVETTPATVNIQGLNRTKQISGKALSDQQCGSSQYIDPWPYNWSWNSVDIGIATVTNNDTNSDGNIDPVQDVVSVAIGSTNVVGSSNGYSDQSQVNVTDSNGGGQAGDPCSSDANACVPDDSYCDIANGYSCNVTTCTCENSGQQCDADTSTSQCNPDDSLCDASAVCNPSSCWCPLPTITMEKPIAEACDLPTIVYSNFQSGSVNFYVDGSLITTTEVNASPPAHQYTLPAGSVPLGTHTITTEVVNNNGSGSDSASYTNNCYPAPLVLSVDPPAGDLQCLNTTFSVMYNQPMKMDGAQDAFELRLLNDSQLRDDEIRNQPPAILRNFDNSFHIAIAADGTIPFYVTSYNVEDGVDGCVSVTNDACTVYIINPTELLPLDQIVLEVLGGVKSIHNIVSTDTRTENYCTNCATQAEVCSLDGVEIKPASWLATRVGDSQLFTAREYSNQGGGRVYIAPTPGYDWTLNWSEDDPDELINTAPADNQNNVTAPVRGQGNASITATATVTVDNVFNGDHLGREKSGTALIRIFICDYPWPDPPPYDIGWNAEMMYCRGDDPNDLLPNLVNEVNLSIGGDLLKDVVFTVDGTQANIAGADIIGLRVFNNPEHASAEGWYQAQGFPQGNPQSTVIDGYSAVIDGRTVYVHFVDVNGNDARSYILVLSYNQNATPETRSIYKKLIKSLFFNRNLNQSDKILLQQDIVRIGGLGAIAEMIKAYGANPSLNTGTYIQGMTTSRWPSWQAVLGNRLGKSLPVDPDNAFNNCPVESGYDSASCFNVNLNPQFNCPDGSHIYIYKNTGDLYANLKYKGLNWVGVGVSNGDDCYSFNINTGLSNQDDDKKLKVVD